jgi:hypothetical protein
MRIANWRADQVFKFIEEESLDTANHLMDNVAVVARQKCPTLKFTPFIPRERPDGFTGANVSFTPKSGRNKGELVSFRTEKRWTGRKVGDLQRTIRRVNRPERAGNVRVYAGNFRTYYAFMVERGTASTGWGGPAKAQPFLRPAFWGNKNGFQPELQKSVKEAATKAMR